MRICQSPSGGQCRITGGVLCSLPRQNGQVSTCLRVSRGASSSAFFGRMLRAVATSTDSLGTMGLIAGIWAEKFDQLAAFQNFIIMPATFLSGVFYSIHSLPPFWQSVSRFNPFFYMIDGFRYGFFGQSDVDPVMSFAIVSIFFLLLAAFAIRLLKSGYKLRH